MTEIKTDAKPAKYDPVAIEPTIMKFWRDNNIYRKAKMKNAGKEKFYFLDGPPYTSGKIHLGTAWNKPLKDMVLRYKRMQGFDVWDRAGYDMHGLPVELKVEEKLGIKFKEEIPKFGTAKFIEECKKFALDNLKIMNNDFRRLGVWMEFDNPYMSITPEFIEGEWWLIKKAHENGRLYEGLKSMHWCSQCATSLAKHELEYENVEDDSIFVKFPVKGRKDEFLVVWTTTPWTIAFNLGVMVHPEFDYIKARVKNEHGKEEIWIVAKGLAGMFIRGVAGKEYVEVEEFKGEKLEGLEYVHPFADIVDYGSIKAASQKTHTIVLSEEFVDLGAGTGLVHMAPGCGPEDFEIGRRNGIPAFNPVDEYGKYPSGMGELSGLVCKKHDKKFTEALEKRGAIIASTKVQHEYAHCWRCKKPVIFRTTRQWFFKVEDLRERMKEENRKITWIPEWAGSRQFDSWLDNLRDNGITRQRYWGTPIPIWKCDKCNEYDVIGSIAELKEKVGQENEKMIPADLHKPWIDEVHYACRCGGTRRRIPDIADVWVDAGTTSWNCLDFPHRKDVFDKLFPADFILEGKDQIRGWFNLLLVASMVSMNRPSFRKVYMHGFVNDALGRKMSKSLGNIISPYEVIDKYGADTFRYYAIGGANPGFDLNYNLDDVKVKRRNMEVLWNLQNFAIDLAGQLDVASHVELEKLHHASAGFGIEEQYMMSRMQSTIKKVTELYDAYELNQVPWAIEALFLDLSRTYIQLVREKSSTGSDDEKKAVLATVLKVMIESLKMLATVAPFVSDSIYLNLKKRFGFAEESIHLCHWPKHDDKMISAELESSMGTSQDIIQAILAGREKAQMGVRWPLPEVVIVSEKEEVKKAAEKLNEIIKTQCNVRSISFAKSFEKVKKDVKFDVGKLGMKFGALAPRVIARLSQESGPSILAHLEKDGKHKIMIDGQEIDIPNDVFIVKREVEKPYVEAEVKSIYVYLNTKMTKELEEEGYVREIMRRIQQMRKNAGLQKQHRIELYMQVKEDNLKMLDEWKDAIKEKVGATSFHFSARKPGKEFSFTEKASIKERDFEIYFEKI